MKKGESFVGSSYFKVVRCETLVLGCEYAAPVSKGSPSL